MTQPTDDIKLPELPQGDGWVRGYKPEYTRRAIEEYARSAVLDDRERQQQKLPANWNHDSSLETWFPLTAETLRKLRAENAELRKDKARLDSGMIMTPERDEFGETFLCERRGMDLREAIDAAMAQEAGRDS